MWNRDRAMAIEDGFSSNTTVPVRFRCREERAVEGGGSDVASPNAIWVRRGQQKQMEAYSCLSEGH